MSWTWDRCDDCAALGAELCDCCAAALLEIAADEEVSA